MNIPPEIADVWNILDTEVTWLHGRWDIYRKLYGTNRARIDALNKIAPTSFWMLQNMLLDDVQLSLSRLRDPPTIGKRRNITLETLANEIERRGFTQLAVDLAAKLGAYRVACGDIVERRNKRIAHLDLQATQLAASNSLSQPSREEIEHAMLALREFMNAIARYFLDTEIVYDHAVFNDSGDHILLAVGHAIRYRELRDEEKVAIDDYAKSAIGRALKR